MTHVKVARRVREHVQHIFAGAGIGGVAAGEGFQLIPNGHPLFLDGEDVVLGRLAVIGGLAGLFLHACAPSVRALGPAS